MPYITDNFYIGDVLAHFGRLPGISSFGSDATGIQVCFSFQHAVKDNVFIVTGANAGVGFENARALAKYGGHVIMACRDKKKADDAINKIKTEFPESTLDFLPLDMSSFKSIKNFVESFNNMQIPLHCLINNAGVYMPSPNKNEAGYDMTLAVNVVGVHYLTKLLLPQLEKTKGRVVNVASEAYRHMPFKDLPTEDLLLTKPEFEGTNTYGLSKLYLILMTRQFAKEIKSSGVSVFSCHPGACLTHLQDNVKGSFKHFIFKVLFDTFGKNPEQMAATQLYSALDPLLTEASGSYLSDCDIVATASIINDKNAKTVYNFFDEVVAKHAL